MESKILSLNISAPAKMVWGDKSIQSSMIKKPVAGPLVIHPTSIEGDSFASPKFHGTPDSVLYAFGIPSALEFVKLMGGENYEHGYLGENLTLDEFDETQISVGDIFEIGEVRVQATYPRIPCAKINYRTQREDGMELLQQAGRSGVYFRILKPGKLYKTDVVKRVEKAKVPFLISEVYQLGISKIKTWPKETVERAVKNGAFPKDRLERHSPKT
jgi:MOSC domain-containing protein YiiM